MPAVAWRSAAKLIAANRLFTIVLIPALLLRVDAELGYRWQSWFNDSFGYVNAAVTLTPDPVRASGYPLYLWLLSPFHNWALVTISQHLMGLAVAVMIYALARYRFGAPAWAAVLGTLPVLYDGFEIQLEHLIMTDTLFLFLAMAAITVVLMSSGGTALRAPRLLARWRKTSPRQASGPPAPSWQAYLAAGLLLGLSSLVRATGIPLFAALAVYLLVRHLPGVLRRGADGGGRRRGLLRLAAGLAAAGIAFAVPVAGYEGWYKTVHGQFAMTNSTGVFLYSRMMTFADCSRMSLPVDLLALCTATPPARRPIAQAYIWTSVSPLDRFPAPKFSPLVNRLAEQFAIKAVEDQPLDYAHAVWSDTIRAFQWNRTPFPDGQTYNEYYFGYQSLAIPADPYRGYPSPEAYYAHGDPATTVVNPFARMIRVYQRYVWLPGTVFGLILLIGLAGIVRGWRGAGREALLPWLCSVALTVAPAATSQFSYRYVLTAVPFACLAAAMTLRAALFPGRHPGGRPDGRLADAGHDQRNLAPDTH